MSSDFNFHFRLIDRKQELECSPQLSHVLIFFEHSRTGENNSDDDKSVLLASDDEVCKDEVCKGHMLFGKLSAIRGEPSAPCQICTGKNVYHP